MNASCEQEVFEMVAVNVVDMQSTLMPKALAVDEDLVGKTIHARDEDLNHKAKVLALDQPLPSSLPTTSGRMRIQLRNQYKGFTKSVHLRLFWVPHLHISTDNN